MFYKNNIKIIPRNLDYLTPLALAIWYLNEGTLACAKEASLFRVSEEDLKYLCLILKNKYNIDTIIQSGFNKKTLYIKNTSMPIFSKIVKPYLLPSLYYKLNSRHNKLTLYGVSDSLTISSTCLTSSLSLLRRNSILKGTSKNVFIKKFSTKRDVSNIKYTTKYKAEYKLSLIQKEALIGIILGDGFLEKPGRNTRLRIEQSYPEKEEYLRSLYTLLEPLATMTPVLLTRKADGRTGTISKSLYFRTLAMPCLNYYYDLFYKERVKIVPQNLDELLTARGLAY